MAGKSNDIYDIIDKCKTLDLLCSINDACAAT